MSQLLGLKVNTLYRLTKQTKQAMVSIKKFNFSPFQENTYVLYNEEKEAWVIDPGCYDQREKNALKNFIRSEGLNVTRLLNTHCHLDHVFGNRFVSTEFDVLPEYHVLDQPTMDMAKTSADLYGIPGFEESPTAVNHLDENDILKLGSDEFEVRFVPGHAPGHIAFVNHQQKFVIGGDILFHRSIGRTDLPGGNFDQLITSIKSQFYTLPPDFKVYSGHGSETFIEEEIKNNPFTKN